jgi:hypothetical protein
MDFLTPLYDQDRSHPISDTRVGRHYQREELLQWLDGFPDRDVGDQAVVKISAAPSALP